MKSHGMWKTKEYSTWRHMKRRCYNKNSKSYFEYGAVGVIVCDRWLNSFQNFIDDVGLAPSPTHTIDRYPNKKGNYEPENVRWATPLQQSNNKSNNRMVDYNNQSKTVAEWAAIIGINKDTLWCRIFRYHWPLEKAMDAGKQKN